MNFLGKKYGLRQKLVWAALLVGALPVILGLVLTYLKGTAELRKAIGANFAGLAREASDKTDLVIGHQLEEITHLAASPEVLGAVRESNRAYSGRADSEIAQALDQRAAVWEKTRRDGRTVHSILSNRAGALLMKSAAVTRGGGPYPSIYAVDSRGALVAAHNLMPPFLSGDRPVYRKAFSGGQGQAFIGDMYRDAASERFLFDLSVPVRDPATGRAVGVLILVSDVEETLRNAIYEIRFGETGHAMLIDGLGNVLICPILPTGMHVADPDLLGAVTGPRSHWSVVQNDAHGGGNSIVGAAPVETMNPILARSGSAPWYSFIRQDPREQSAPIRSLLAAASTASVILLGLLGLLALAVSRRLFRPIEILHEGTERIGRGDLTHRLTIKTGDEIERLADEFNRMTEHLEDSYKTLEHRVADRTRELSALNAIALTVNQSLDLQEILDGALVKILEAMRMEAGIIRLWDESRNRLYIKSHRGLPDDLVRSLAEISTDFGIAGRAFQLGEAVVIDETRRSPLPDSPVMRAGYRSVVSLPIQSKNRRQGTLTVIAAAARRFAPSELQLLSSITSQVGTAVENATLFARERTMVERLKELDRIKTEFLSNVSHELRMPLTAIIGFSELMLDRIPGDLTPDQEEYVRNMLDSGQHLLEIINNLLNLSKLRAGKMETHYQTFAVPPVIETVTRMGGPLVSKKGLTLESDLEAELPPIESDEGKIKQILLNLLSNAVKFTPAGGRIRISARRTTLENRPSLEIAVSDTGIGIRPEDKSRIFDEFQQVDSSYTRDYSGTGLGLAITRQFTELIGGRISVDSQPGRGSTFRVTLPFRTAPVPAEEARDVRAAAAPPESETRRLPVPATTPGGDLPRLLVVEDDPAVSRLMALYLTQEGYHVEHAADGEQAVEMARRIRPFAITLDIMLPKKDGWEVLQKLKQLPETKDIPVIIVSIIENRELGFSLGATDYFSKPIDRNGLMESLRKLNLSSRIMRKPVNILIIDDDPQILQLVTALLESEGYGVLRAQRAMDGIDLAIEVQPDLILLDLLMPEMSGFDALERLKQHPTARNIPVIIFTSDDLSREDRERINSKIRGFLQKGQSIREMLLTEIRKFEKLYPDKARMVDGLTGFYNERYLHNRIADEAGRAQRFQRPFSLLMTNLDGFQALNRKFGIEAGNRVLREAAELFRRNTRSANPLCRCGGSSFAVILTETTKELAGQVGEKMRSVIESHSFVLDGDEGRSLPPQRLTVSVGVSTFFEDGRTPEQILSQGFAALDRARSLGGNRVVKSAGLESASDGPEGRP